MKRTRDRRKIEKTTKTNVRWTYDIVRIKHISVSCWTDKYLSISIKEHVYYLCGMPPNVWKIISNVINIRVWINIPNLVFTRKHKKLYRISNLMAHYYFVLLRYIRARVCYEYLWTKYYFGLVLFVRRKFKFPNTDTVK